MTVLYLASFQTSSGHWLAGSEGFGGMTCSVRLSLLCCSVSEEEVHLWSMLHVLLFTQRVGIACGWGNAWEGDCSREGVLLSWFRPWSLAVIFVVEPSCSLSDCWDCSVASGSHSSAEGGCAEACERYSAPSVLKPHSSCSWTPSVSVETPAVSFSLCTEGRVLGLLTVTTDTMWLLLFTGRRAQSWISPLPKMQKKMAPMMLSAATMLNTISHSSWVPCTVRS